MFNRRSILKGALAVPAIALASRLERVAAQTTTDYGVASGEPRPDGVTLWTRVPEAFQTTSLSVTYAVSTTESFSTLVASGQVTTDASSDYTVKVALSGLQPFTRYYYRFTSDSGYTSVTGRTRTAPATGSDPTELTFVYVSCQDYTEGYYTVFAALAQEVDVDFCVHLGDNIYETGAANFQNGQIRLDPVLDATTLDEYRSKYKLYLSDPDYREVRRQFCWIHLWDDHEVFDNYAGTTLTAEERTRQTNGYTAFLEYMPVQPVVPLTTVNGVSSVQLYRKLPFGNLVDLFVLDERQYRDGVVCSRDLAITACPELFDTSRTMLGTAQKQWLKSELAASPARWKVLLNEVMMMRFEAFNFDPQAKTPKIPPFFSLPALTDQGLYINLDAWDGYPAERTELLQFIEDERIANVAVWTGDIHNCYAGQLRPDFSNYTTPPVAVEVVGGSVASAGVYELLGGVDITRVGFLLLNRANRHIQYVDLKYHVYTKVTVTAQAMTFEYRAVGTITETTSAAFTLKTLRILDGQPKLLP